MQTPNASQVAAPLSSTERLNYWSRTNPNEPIPASVFFAQRIPDAQILQLMRRYNV
ncbi:hypothetical protein [Chroogloeocystis siderophila]|jgi:hypothetical protein|uniref:hypothetical protein n=1 Tax=Chroogloeocystis siderophila TaxID=329163 RepID=UPI0015B9F67B|nr:hypothetical protein [Chroogloeocystis siderophila]